jgi:DNA-binding response OmpR family regulator
MCSTAILAIGLDWPVTEGDRRAWQSAGYFVTWTNSIREAIEWFRFGDFDLVLLGGSIPPESRERLAFLIRASGANTPVVSITDSSADCDAFAEATSGHEPGEVFRRIGEILASNTRSRPQQTPRQLPIRRRVEDALHNSDGRWPTKQPV